MTGWLPEGCWKVSIALPGCRRRGRNLMQRPGLMTFIFQERFGCAAFAKSEQKLRRQAAGLQRGHLRNIECAAGDRSIATAVSVASS